MAATNLYRLYESSELGTDGYSAEWHRTIKHEVREASGHRCVRCLHPYRPGRSAGHLAEVGPGGEWSVCDERCAHDGEVRFAPAGGEGWGIEMVTDAATIRSYLADGFRVEAHWRILTVHHLDMNKANCRWWNLAPLCQRDHLAIQGKVQMERVWPWEHSPWMKPFAAGYYAWFYLEEDLTREETLARLDELLALERLA